MRTDGSSVKLYLLDVEGTTSPVSLVYEQLFPYARWHMESYLRAHIDEPEIARDVEQLAGLGNVAVEAVSADGAEPDLIHRAVAEALYLMDQDFKVPLLKRLQGKVWKDGYESGMLAGTVFPDVPAALERWSRQAKVAIYSSGSVEAQQLLFRHSSAGDLTRFISAYFDTEIGPKTASASYLAIAEQMQVAPEDVLFFSDVLRELDPAREAGCQTRLVVREGNAAVAEGHTHFSVSSFAEI
jgi:enolase-phosphatase E1